MRNNVGSRHGRSLQSVDMIVCFIFFTVIRCYEGRRPVCFFCDNGKLKPQLVLSFGRQEGIGCQRMKVTNFTLDAPPVTTS